MGKIVKKSYCILIGIMMGVVLAYGGVYAATTIMGSNITYSNANSGLSSTHIQGAIDELYDKIKNPTSKVYYYGTFKKNNNMYTFSGDFFENTVYHKEKTYFKYTNKKWVLCITQNTKEECFDIYRNYENEVKNIKQVFGEENCVGYKTGPNAAYPGIRCSNNDFECSIEEYMAIGSCTDKKNSVKCSTQYGTDGKCITTS